MQYQGRQFNKRLIFTVTSGRSGTGYLARVLKVLPRVTALHEPPPRFSDVMRAVQRDPQLAAKFWVEEKLPAAQACFGETYIETSHLFCKGFAGSILELGLVPDLIVLRRPFRQVASSLYRINAIPGRTKRTRAFYLSPDDPGVLPFPGWQGAHDYQLCYWYCLEIERRAKQYSRLFAARGARVAEVTLAEVTTFRGYLHLLRKLKLRYLTPGTWLRYRRVRSERVNRKLDEVVQKAASLDVDALEAEVLAHLDRSPAAF